MKIYQIVVQGPYKNFSGLGKFHSKKVFSDKTKAEAYKEEFIQKCIGDGFNDLERVDIIKILELELDEN